LFIFSLFLLSFSSILRSLRNFTKIFLPVLFSSPAVRLQAKPSFDFVCINPSQVRDNQICFGLISWGLKFDFFGAYTIWFVVLVCSLLICRFELLIVHFWSEVELKSKGFYWGDSFLTILYYVLIVWVLVSDCLTIE